AAVTYEGGASGYTPRRVILANGSTADGFVHPNYASEPEAYLGPGLSIFQGSGLLENTMQIWGGANWHDGGHGVGTYVLNSGQRSQYAASYSSLVSAALAL